MRRHEREVTGLGDILAILEKCEVLRLGLCVGAEPYIVPLNFAFEADGEKVSIYLHCASEGRRLDMLSQNPNVCFEADCSFKTLTSDIACRWSAEYESVIGWGRAEILPDEAQKSAALDLIMKRYGFEGAPQYSPQSMAAVTVLRISVTSVTGKRRTA